MLGSHRMAHRRQFRLERRSLRTSERGGDRATHEE